MHIDRSSCEAFNQKMLKRNLAEFGFKFSRLILKISFILAITTGVTAGGISGVTAGGTTLMAQAAETVSAAPKAAAKAAPKAAPKAALILIPGTGNSFFNAPYGLGAYFSDAIRLGLEMHGFHVLMIQDLLPFGTFEENGDRVYEAVKHWYKSHYPNNDIPLLMLGHSAGGFYALRAATRISQENANNSSGIPLKQILFLSTPLSGAMLANLALSDPNLRSTLRGISQQKNAFVDLRGLMQMRSDEVKNFLDGVRISPEVQLTAFAGYQKSPNWFQLFSAYFLSPVFQVLTKYIGKESDGIVELESSLANNIWIQTRSGVWSQVRVINQWLLPLDHPEQVLDYRVFAAMGTKHANWIQESQMNYYPILVESALQLEGH